jgi:hypothetical protein
MVVAACWLVLRVVSRAPDMVAVLGPDVMVHLPARWLVPLELLVV